MFIDNYILDAANMIIKIDCREKELLEMMKPAASTSASTSVPAPTPASEPDHYIMDLGDGITMKVPLPKNKAITKATKAKSSRTITF